MSSATNNLINILVAQLQNNNNNNNIRMSFSTDYMISMKKMLVKVKGWNG